MKISLLCIVTTSLVLAGCSDSPSENEADQQDYAGFFTYGHEVSSFKSCNDAKVYWLNGDKADMAEIVDASLALAKERGLPYQSIYIDFSGYIESQPANGFASGYDGVIQLELVNDVAQTPPAGCK